LPNGTATAISWWRASIRIHIVIIAHFERIFMTGMEQGINMDNYFTNPLYWLLVVVSTVLTFGLIAWRRKFRKSKRYDTLLPYFVAGNVIVCIAPFGLVMGWADVVSLFIPFFCAGVLQVWEVLQWSDEQEIDEAKAKAHHDPAQEVA
jgi:hypothetical protein